ncbi:uncharacterized protein LOC142352804 isoform X2 [Convolutriloba macropyga]|uniref:uncharacterized protein LOC142352804 isoform X2 n=1 Tax=Convolutriloba macropyga TaxID=536237 RepID=UPI003F51B3A0
MDYLILPTIKSFTDSADWTITGKTTSPEISLIIPPSSTSSSSEIQVTSPDYRFPIPKHYAPALMTKIFSELLMKASETSNDYCMDCYRDRIQTWEYYGRTPGVHVPTIIVCFLLYLKCIQTLRASKQIARKDLLIRAFVALLITWTVMVTPHTVFVDFVNKGQTFGFSRVLWIQMNDVSIEMSGAVVDDIDSDPGKRLRQIESRNYTIEAILRLFKMSFGFVNSILLIILIKPFHKPLLDKLNTVRTKIFQKLT